MVFAAVGSRNNSVTDTSSVTHTVDLPPDLVSGDGILISMALDGGDDCTDPSGYTRLGSAVGGSHRVIVWWKVSDGGEGATVVITSSGPEQSAHRSWRIETATTTDWGSVPPEIQFVSGTAFIFDPPAINASWTSGDDTLFIAGMGCDDNEVVDVFPTSYGNTATQVSNASGGGNCTDAIADREVSTSGAEDPSEFSLVSESNEDYAAYTIAVPPSGAVLSTFTPEQTDWRWFQDDAQDPTTGNALAAENTKPVLADARNFGVIRLRMLIEENGGGASTNGILKLQASGDGTNWFDATSNAGEVHVYVTDGQGINNSAIVTTRLVNADASGEYREDQIGTQTIDADETGLEIDFALRTNIVVPGADYSFRLLWNGAPVPVKSGSSIIQLQGTAEADRSNTVVKLDLVSASGEPDTLRVSHSKSVFYDGVGRWWVFYNQQNAGQATTMRYKSTADLSGGWSSESTVTFTDINSPQRQSLTFKTIGGTPYVFMMVADTGTQWWFKRGSISGSTITWDSERSITAQPSGADRSVAPVLSIDDGDFLWIAGLADGVTTDVWAAQSVNTADDATYYTFNTAKLLTDSGAEGGADNHHIIGLASGEALMVYIDFGGGELKAVKVTEAGGFGTPVIVEAGFGGSNESDWGVVRGTDGNVYCVFKDSVSNSADLALEVYSESGDSWAAGTSPSITGVGTSTDGHPLAWGDDDKLYVFGTFVGGGGGNDTIVQYKAYTGGTAGTWDGSLTTMPGSGPGQGNKDGISSQVSGGVAMGGKIVVLGEEGDDPNDGTEWILGFYVLDASGGGAIIKVEGETVQIVEGDIGVLGLVRQEDETVQISEDDITVVGLVRQEGETVQIPEGDIRVVGLIRQEDEVVQIAENDLHILGKIKQEGDTVQIPEGDLHVLGQIKQEDEAVQITEDDLHVLGLVRLEDETIQIPEGSIKLLTLVKLENEAVNVSGPPRYLDLPGTSGHNATTPADPDFEFAGREFFVGAFASLDDWSSGLAQNIFTHWLATGDQRAWILRATAAGSIHVRASDDGLTNEGVTGPSLGFADFSKHWLGFDFSIGFIRYYDGGTDPDNPHWVEIGSGAQLPSITTVHNSTADAEVGTTNDGIGNPMKGKVYRTVLYPNLTRTGIAADFNANDFSVGESDADTAIDSTGKTWTIHGVSSVIGGQEDIRVLGLFKQEGEILQIVEGDIPVVGLVRLEDETLQISELDLHILGQIKQEDETVEITDADLHILGQIKVEDETVEATEGDIHVLDLVRLENETVQIPEGNIVTLDLVKIESETLDIPELDITVRDIVRIENELVNIIEGVITVLDLVKIESDTIQITEGDIHIAGLVRVELETLEISEGDIHVVVALSPFGTTRLTFRGKIGLPTFKSKIENKFKG